MLHSDEHQQESWTAIPAPFVQFTPSLPNNMLETTMAQLAAKLKQCF